MKYFLLGSAFSAAGLTIQALGSEGGLLCIIGSVLLLAGAGKP